MIKQIDISNFGSFRNFRWSVAIRDKGNNIAHFKKLNILYGRNYSGKTTLSRVFRSLETGKLPEKYETPSFSVTTSSSTITHTQIPVADQEIRVFNRDFIEDHLSFLRDSKGKITPFAIIGSENKAIKQEIDDIEKKLGNIEDKTGLKFEFHSKHSDFEKQESLIKSSERSINQKLIDKANKPPTGIKHNSLYKDVNYDIRKIQADINAVRINSIAALTPEEKEQKVALLREAPLPDIHKNLTFTPNISKLYKNASQILSKKITPTNPIQELLNDAILQAWVKTGIPQHRNKRNRCGFCGQLLPDDLWYKLDKHFNQESTDLEAAIKENIEMVKQEREEIDAMIKVDHSDFYSTFQNLFNERKTALDDEIATYRYSLDSLIKSLNNRCENIFAAIPASNIIDNSVLLSTKIAAMNQLIELNNSKTKTLATDQMVARNNLRLGEISQFIKEIDLEGEEKIIAELREKAKKIQSEVNSISEKIKKLESRVELLKKDLKDEIKGAEKVNNYLNNYFGHVGLKLEAAEDSETSTFNFQIYRGNNLAYNLSEGECSLVSFCYFIAKLEDSKSKGKKLIIFIDDPVSSLDNNHIFFVFSLIESVIAKPEEDAVGNIIKDVNDKPIYRYEQLFISTHNLELLKYLKRITVPSKDNEHFILVRKGDESSLELMPDHLRNYITEFNYLFGEIYTCAEPTNASTQYHSFYNFGNNLRKFLEAFLFFKYPCVCNGKTDFDGRIKKFFRGEKSCDPLVMRLINEFSHLGEYFDRGIQPIDCAEISKLAKFVLQKIKENDCNQFECFLKSIDKQDLFLTPEPVSLSVVSSAV